ncbi:MAG: deoxyribonuclease IV [Peptococcaceae bacterium]|nr:deoxyribonuclease IV [Peptococcaceae bacterium]
MLHLGAHMSTGKGFDKAAEDAQSIGADTMQVFTRNPRGGKARVLKDKELERLAQYRQQGLMVVCHAPYTINLASSSDDVRDFGKRTIAEDLKRMQQLGALGLVIHSGAHTGAGREEGLNRLIASLEVLLPQVAPGTRILLETMSGSGSELGSRLEDLQQVLAYFDHSPALGLCLDTCHLFAAGYDIRDWPAFKAHFETFLPWSVVGCIHMNDSKTTFASHKDRHEKLGQGSIGWDAFKAIVQAESACQLPIIMETPNVLPGWADEIAVLRNALKA